MNYKISHPTKEVVCEITLPSSKSISNRLLIIQALCKENFTIENLSNSDDAKVLKKALNSTEKTIDIGAAGTSFRFLTAYLATLNNQEFLLTGSERMKQRPIKKLVNVLINMGAEIEYLEQYGFPPLKIKGQKLKGNNITIDASVSSQFISAILLIAPTLTNGISLTITGDIVSKPYIKMTLSLMQEFGISHTWVGNEIEIKSQKYIAKNFCVEADWSAASFWFEIAALSKKCNIKLNGLQQNSIQGDIEVIALFNNLGVATTLENNSFILTKKESCNIPTTIDLINTPDLYQPLKCTLHALGLSPKINGLTTLKNKETDRVVAVETELEKLNTSKIIETYDDHRMAMSFAPLSLKYGNLEITNGDVISKSYPNFWKDLEKGSFITMPLTH